MKITFKEKMTVKRAFTRVDLIVLISVILFLGAWFGYAHIGEWGHAAVCAGNLKVLGEAMHSYAAEHDDALPAAAINLINFQTSWDTQLLPYLKPAPPPKTDGGYPEKYMQTISRRFFCPSDIPRASARSYAMAGNDMSPSNWPPGPDSATGVGLVWNKKTIDSLLGDATPQTPESLPSIKLSSLPAPADTVLLTEFINPKNLMGSVENTTVSSVAKQFPGDPARFHGGKFNYLMADGHVELLTLLQTGSLDGSAGIWSLKKGN